MSQKIRNFVLRSLPYLISIAGGVILFSISLDNVKDPAIESLISNISASLLAIPLVFLLYDYTTSRVSRQLQKTIAGGINNKVNTIIFHLILVLRRILQMQGHITRANITTIHQMSKAHMINRIRIHPQDSIALHQYYQELINIALGYGKDKILSQNQLQVLTELTHDLSRMVAACHTRQNKHVIAQHIHNITKKITDWLDSGLDVSQDFDRIINATVPPEKSQMKKSAQ